MPRFIVYPASHYVTPREEVLRAMTGIKAELKERLAELYADGRIVEAQRLQQRTLFDLEMLDRGGLLQGHRKLLPPPHGPSARRGAALSHRLPPVRQPHVLRREPRDDGPARRHVQRRPRAQGDARQLRLPSSVRAGQPAAPFRRVRAQDAPQHLRLGDARRLRAREEFGRGR